MKIYNLLTLIYLLFIGNFNCKANADTLVNNKIIETTCLYAHHSPIILKCKQGNSFELNIQRFKTKHTFRIVPSGYEYTNFNKLSFVFSDGKTITVENKTPTNGITCYFGKIWETDELWQWLENKELNTLVINDDSEIVLKNKSLIKSILTTLDEQGL